MKFNEIDKQGRIVVCLNKSPEYFPSIFSPAKFFFDDKKYFFKQRDDLAANIYGELLAAKIGEKMGLNVLKVKPAIVKFNNDEIDGIISKNFISDDDIRLTAITIKDKHRHLKNHYETIISLLEKYIKVEMNYSDLSFEIDKSVYKDLQSLIFFDFLTFQSDRDLRNIEFVLQKQKDKSWKIKLAPIYDNGMIFGYEELGLILYNTKKGLSDYRCKAILNKCLNRTFLFSFDDNFKYKTLTNTIKNLLKRNNHLQKLALKAYKLNILDCINEIEVENPGFKFDNTHKKLAQNGWEQTIKTLKELNVETFEDKQLDF